MQGRIAGTYSLSNIVSFILGSVLLSGCLSEEQESTGFVDDSNVVTDQGLTGSVGDGPIIGAAMQVLASDGELLMEFESDSNAEYDVVVRTKGKHYPLQVHARNGVDLVTNLAPDFRLTGIAAEPGKKSVANVNPYSTFAFELASELGGGMSKSSLESAEGIVVRVLGGGLSSIRQTGPLSTPIGPDNAAEIVRGAEELGEIVRRTRDSMSSFGNPTDGDGVVGMLASDLTDEVINGRGGARANARASAISIMASAGVMLESMAGELHVYGVNASSSLDLAIDRITGGAATQTLADLGVTDGQLVAARRGLAIAEALRSDPRISAVLSAADGVRAGMDSVLARSLLPGDYRTVANEMLMLVASGDDALIAEVNRMATDGVDQSPVNQAPVIDGTPPAAAAVGSLYEFTPTASDPDGDDLSFSGSGLPAWASVDPVNGTLSGTPELADAGVVQDISITASDGEFTATLGPFSIEVVDPVQNQPPAIGGSPATNIDAGSFYEFTPTASDPNGDTLTFSGASIPSWLSLDPATGTLSGMPGEGNVGSYNGLVITVSDNEFSASLPQFSITVESTVEPPQPPPPPPPPSNSPPTIGGQPASSVVEGQQYVFTPEASDDDGDSLSFSAQRLPAWLTISATTGRISGTPGAGDVGVYNGIEITVSDGTDTASLGQFSIEVTAAGSQTGSVTLTWTAPTLNTDGSALTDIAGYRVYWGSGAGNYPNSATINNPGVTTYVIEDLAFGDYEAVATAFNDAGVESGFSGSVSFSVNQ